ncbi:MAG: TIGR01777 family protein [Deltaproteobacteria bacterium]|nr:MAG: TIGR01777 family protein [Deltaproteobacteria bacterium]TMB37233.1 MAG: TIGR01777 family protein [Deltaproteobacteria bacterium]
MRVVVAGASGLIGSALTRALRERGDAAAALPRFASAPWTVEGADAVVNLAGASVAGKRWSPAYKKEIEQSRVLTTRAVVDAIRAAQRKPRVLINASAVGYYGGRGDEVLDESAAPGADFLANVGRQWEAEAQRAPVRSVQLRTGIVLSARGGALEKMLPPFKAFVGGPVGSGRQWFPWIHLADEVAAILWCIDREVTGPVNLAAPGIVTMKEFAKALGRALHRPSWAPVPAAPLRILLGEFASALLEGQRAVPKKLLDSGFRFRFDNVDAALRDLFPER